MCRDDVGPMGPSRAYCGRTSVEVTDDVGAVTCAVCRSALSRDYCAGCGKLHVAWDDEHVCRCEAVEARRTCEQPMGHAAE
jgi:hypothetical protein